MFSEFVNWYHKKLKNSPIIVILATITAIFASFGSIHGGVQAVHSVKVAIESTFYENEKLYSTIKKINTDLNVDYINDLFGKPSIIKHITIDSVNYIERVYVHDKFFTYIISDDTQTIMAYAITIRTPDFKPPVPLNIGSGDENWGISNLRLGELKLLDLKSHANHKPQTIIADMSSKFISYTESHYYGNPGLYKTYLFGYSPSGYNTITEKETELIFDLAWTDNLSHDDIIVAELRSNFIPNSFGVISFKAESSLVDVLTDTMIGVDYFDARELF